MGNGISYKRKKKEKQKLRKKCYNKVIGETCGLMIWYDSLFLKKIDMMWQLIGTKKQIQTCKREEKLKIKRDKDIRCRHIRMLKWCVNAFYWS